MPNPYFKELDQIIGEMITDLQNQNPNVDISQGSVMFIKSVAFASAIWGTYKYLDYVKDQIFPDTADRENLEHHASVLGVTIDEGDTDTNLLKKVLDQLRNPTAGGNRYDVARWAKSVATLTMDIPLDSSNVTSITNSGFVGTTNISKINDLSVKTTALDTNSAPANSSILIQFVAEKKVAGMAFFVTGKGHPGRFEIKGSNGGTTFTTLAISWTIGNEGWNYIDFTEAKVTHLKIILSATHTTTSAMINEIMCFGISETEDEATEVVVFDNSPQPGQFETMAFKVVDGLKKQLSAKTLSQIQGVVDQLKPVGTYGFSILPLMAKKTNVSVSVTGPNVDTSFIRTGIESLLANMKPGQNLFRESITAVCVQNGAESVTISQPSANISVLYYETIVAGDIIVGIS
jgi:hypothetical protein